MEWLAGNVPTDQVALSLLIRPGIHPPGPERALASTGLPVYTMAKKVF